MGKRFRFDRRCTHCQAPIVFICHAATGRMMPFDVAPVPARTLEPAHRWRINRQTALAYMDSDVKGDAYIPHFGTCPKTQKTPPKTAIVRARWEGNRGEEPS